MFHKFITKRGGRKKAHFYGGAEGNRYKQFERDFIRELKAWRFIIDGLKEVVIDGLKGVFTGGLKVVFIDGLEGVFIGRLEESFTMDLKESFKMDWRESL